MVQIELKICDRCGYEQRGEADHYTKEVSKVELRVSRHRVSIKSVRHSDRMHPMLCYACQQEVGAFLSRPSWCIERGDPAKPNKRKEGETVYMLNENPEGLLVCPDGPYLVEEESIHTPIVMIRHKRRKEPPHQVSPSLCYSLEELKDFLDYSRFKELKSLWESYDAADNWIARERDRLSAEGEE